MKMNYQQYEQIANAVMDAAQSKAEEVGADEGEWAVALILIGDAMQQYLNMCEMFGHEGMEMLSKLYTEAAMKKMHEEAEEALGEE